MQEDQKVPPQASTNPNELVSSIINSILDGGLIPEDDHESQQTLIRLLSQNDRCLTEVKEHFEGPVTQVHKKEPAVPIEYSSLDTDAQTRQCDFVIACKSGTLADIKALLSQGAHVDTPNAESQYPLSVALNREVPNPRVVYYLAERLTCEGYAQAAWSRVSLKSLEATLGEKRAVKLESMDSDSGEDQKPWSVLDNYYKTNRNVCQTRYDKLFGDGEYDDDAAKVWLLSMKEAKGKRIQILTSPDAFKKRLSIVISQINSSIDALSRFAQEEAMKATSISTPVASANPD